MQTKGPINLEPTMPANAHPSPSSLRHPARPSEAAAGAPTSASADPPTPAAQGRASLAWHVSIACLLGMAITIACLLALFRDLASQHAMEHGAHATHLTAHLHAWQWRALALVGLTFVGLYAFLVVVIRKADRVLASRDRERVEREREIWHQAHHDPLTQLPNRSLFARELDAALHAPAVADREVAGALLYIDLDRFKMVNDGFGHQAGDDVLGAAAARLRECLRSGDRLYRVGGDEFTVILQGLCAREDAARVAMRISREMARAIEIDQQRFKLGATVGIALFPRDASDADSLVSNANAAMRSAKRVCRGEHVFYSHEMSEDVRLRLALEAELQRAFGASEFVLHFQPRVAAHTRRIRSVEALIRWQRPGHGLVAPGHFIGVLEQMELMPHVGEWVLRAACTQLRCWHEQGLVHLGVSVNVSARQLQQPDFAVTVRRVLSDTGVDPRSVELELTESVLIEHTEHARGMLSALRDQGVRIAIDDFGTGYASLTYLRQLPVDGVKLDRSFVAGIEHNPQDRALSTAIGEMARSLNLTLVAEGVETEGQATFLAGIHCTEMQGFLFSRPEPADKLAAALAVCAAGAEQGVAARTASTLAPAGVVPAMSSATALAASSQVLAPG